MCIRLVIVLAIPSALQISMDYFTLQYTSANINSLRTSKLINEEPDMISEVQWKQ